jgi:hypothetical protein
MSKDHNDDVQRLLVHFKRGLLRESPSSSKLLHILPLKMCLENAESQMGLLKLRGISGSRSHRRRRSSCPDEGPPTSPRTPAGTVREVTNTEQSATTKLETPPARTSNNFLRPMYADFFLLA